MGPWPLHHFNSCLVYSLDCGTNGSIDQFAVSKMMEELVYKQLSRHLELCCLFQFVSMDVKGGFTVLINSDHV